MTSDGSGAGSGGSGSTRTGGTGGTGGTGIGSAADLQAAAAKFTGLSDFGPDEYRDGLEVLIESYVSEAGLTPAGVKSARAMLRGALMARLLSQSAWTQHPEHADVRIERPIFVTGLPRTGTTALHRLLVADPGHQGLELWLAEMPQPRPPRDTWAEHPVFQMVQKGVQRHRVSRPEFLGVHELGADQVEECWQLLRQSMRSISWECLGHLPSYSSWLRTQDWTSAYQRHRRNLQLIGLPDQDKRWVLKNPSHLFALDALLEVYPDALIIQTHRSPRTAIASACSLAAQATKGWSEVFTGDVIGRDQMETWARGLDTFSAARARYDQGQFFDVDYDDFAADPLGTVESIYGRFGLELTGAAADAMRALIASDAAARTAGSIRTADGEAGGEGDGAKRRPAHRYSLEEFGLTAEQVDERFAAYLAARA